MIDLFELQSCKRCNGSGYIPDYKHVQDGICFSCWGTGDKTFNTNYPELNRLLKTQIESNKCSPNKNELIKEVASLCQSYNDYNSYLKVAETETEEDHDGMWYYDNKMNEIITKLYSLSKCLKESGVLIDNR